MPDVTIRRCVLRVVRHGGWSWGPEPKRLVSAAVHLLPGLLATELERLAPEDAAGEVSGAVRLDVRVSLAQLRALARVSSEAVGDASALAFGPATASASEAIREPVRRALEAAGVAARLARVTPPAAQPAWLQVTEDAGKQRSAAVLRLLIAWSSGGRLDGLLHALPDELIVAWHRVVFESGSRVAAWTEAQSTIAAALRAHLDKQEAEALPGVTPRRDCIRDRLRASAALAARPDIALSPTAITQAMDRLLPLSVDEATRPRGSSAQVRPAKGRRVTPGTDVAIASALPFLLLGPLSRIGWIEVADATLAGAELDDAWPALAVALATKVLAEPERGWRRQPAAARAAATFAGVAEACSDADVGELARRAGGLVPGLDAVVRESLLAGRRSGAPVVLCVAGAVRMVVDPEGGFLLGLAADDQAAARCAAAANAPAFVPAEDASVGLLRALDGTSVTFVTPAAPVRGERWRMVPHTRSPRLFTNGHVAPVIILDETAARARDTWGELERRPLGGHDTDPALDRSVSLAAALALGTIAWELWRMREPTSPLLALQRFGDLEATVRFERHQIRVRLPLGKRFKDLERAGFLADVQRVPWLENRPVVFSGG